MLVCYSGDVNTRNKIPDKTKVNFLLVYTLVIHLENSSNWTEITRCLLYLLSKDCPPYLLLVEVSCLSHQEAEFICLHLNFGLSLTSGKQPKCSSGTTEPKPEEDWQLPLATCWSQLLWYETPKPCGKATGRSLRCSNWQLQVNFHPSASGMSEPFWMVKPNGDQLIAATVSIPWNKTAQLRQPSRRILGDNKLLRF